MIHLVTGFMRSGTSLLVEACEAGGMQVVHSQERNQFNEANRDGNYKPNPNGLYEPDTREMRIPGWPRQHDGRVLKCVVPWLGHLSVHKYRVVVMRRDPLEIRHSFLAFPSNSVNGIAPPMVDVDRIDAAVNEAIKTLRNRRDVIGIVEVNYRDELLANPVNTLARLRNFGWPIDVHRAASVVKPDLCHFRRENLVGL